MKYNYTFSGLGLSTILVLNEMFENNLLLNKSILIIEPNELTHDEKTWCFWENKNGKWDEYVSSTWNNALFKNENISVECLKGNLTYKQISSVNFIESLFKKLKSTLDITFVKERF